MNNAAETKTKMTGIHFDFPFHDFLKHLFSVFAFSKLKLCNSQPSHALNATSASNQPHSAFNRYTKDLICNLIFKSKIQTIVSALVYILCICINTAWHFPVCCKYEACEFCCCLLWCPQLFFITSAHSLGSWTFLKCHSSSLRQLQRL